MASKANFRFVFAIGIFLIAIYVFYASWEWPWRSAFFPQLIASGLLCLSTFQIILWLLGTDTERKGHAIDFELTQEVEPRIARLRALAAFGWIVGFFFLIFLVGFPVAVPLLIFLYLKFVGKEEWPLTIILTALGWLFMEGLFIRLLHVRFADGWLIYVWGRIVSS
jgi:hypothetical protein